MLHIPNVTAVNMVMVTTQPMANVIVEEIGDHTVMVNVPRVVAQKRDVPNPHAPNVLIPVKKAENVVESQKENERRSTKPLRKKGMVKRILMFQ